MKFLWIAVRVIAYMLWILKDLAYGRWLLKKGRLAEKDALVWRVAVNWSKFCVNVTKSTVELIGEENLPPIDEPVLVVANHQSAFDIPFILGYLNRPIGFISKKENRQIPLLGPWLELGNCVFIDRGNPREGVKSIAAGAQLLKGGYAQALFPEGTRSLDGSIQPFKAGGFKLAEKAGVRVVPVTLINGNHLMPKGTFKIRAQKIKIIISPPIDMTGISTNEMAQITHDIIAGNLSRYS